MKKIIISLLVLVVVAGAAYYIVFKNLSSEETETYTYNEETNTSITDMEVPTPTGTQTAPPSAVTPTTPATSTPAPIIPTPSSVTVNIKNFSYNPQTLNIKSGTKVTWVNNDSISHTVTSDSGNLLNSGLIAPGGSFSFTFTSAVSENYHCTPHPPMRGSIVVTD